jgi:hypothetical protein
LEKTISKIKFIVDSTHFDKQYAQFIAPTETVKKKNEQILHPLSPEFRRLKKEAEEMFIDINDKEIKDKMVSLYIQTGNFNSR